MDAKDLQFKLNQSRSAIENAIRTCESRESLVVIESLKAIQESLVAVAQLALQLQAAQQDRK